ncbi:pseudouridine synthase [Aidingimonas halophila]|uniref:Pseudouridine synthase n=1 Tax=Aidingimonas halophila TaxID=574349 RepID=A0A1H3ELF9_9GAMM|nr:pseudouridine synthase [Aidingimonas halophila]GHC31344.1 ribosomal large subunit pseudouridine synthase E [Aidingimonas halophila]SDX79531.1 23S rRNA pseudouridine2457 synthase [Aidingimonas halophila]
MSSLYLLHKPYRVLSQFRDHEGRSTLADIIDIPDIYPAGRLDYESEGLLLLSDDGQLIHRISHPRHKQPKTYWVQVEGVPGDDALAALRGGIPLNDGMTRPARVQRLKTPDVPERDPPVRQRQNIPTHWLEITLSEGRNRQVRRMTAHVDLPTLRLIRVAVGPWRLGDLKPGEWRSETLHAPVSPKQGSSYRAGRVRR